MVGLVSSFWSPHISIAVVGAWAFCSMIIEYFVLGWVYGKIEILHAPKKPKTKKHSDETDTETEAMSVFDSWRRYRQHPVFLASVAYSFLYMSVINFGGQMTSYLKIIGLNDAYLAGGRGIAALSGVAATYMYKPSVAKYGIFKTAFVSTWAQLICIVPCVVAFMFHEHLRVWIICGGIILSRCGLWGFDMAEQQIMQERVDKHESGAIGGTESALVNVMTLLAFVLSLVFYKPRQFFYPVAISASFVVCAALTYSTYYFRGNFLQEKQALLDPAESGPESGSESGSDATCNNDRNCLVAVVSESNSDGTKQSNGYGAITQHEEHV
jgi:solute carrier family 40 (iron-regulated transporter), member 1